MLVRTSQARGPSSHRPWGAGHTSPGATWGPWPIPALWQATQPSVDLPCSRTVVGSLWSARLPRSRGPVTLSALCH